MMKGSAEPALRTCYHLVSQEAWKEPTTASNKTPIQRQAVGYGDMAL